MKLGALLLCGGKGERLGLPEDKALATLCGRPLFTWSLDALRRSHSSPGIVIVGPVAKLRAALANSGVGDAGVVGWTEGGRQRQDSVARGLAALPPEYDVVAVHDCARALVTPDVIDRAVSDAAAHGAAIAAVPLEDTLKRATLGVIDQTVPRAGLWRAQTPQVFRREWLEQAHATAVGVATDDAALLEAAGRRVRVTPGDVTNFKITWPGDLAIAAAVLEARNGGG
jgi:2-C-methyl-D-erythritol 4-phosphate cytidylyltransferase